MGISRIDAGDHAGDAGGVFHAAGGGVRDVDAEEHGSGCGGKDVGFTGGQGLFSGGDLLVDAPEADVPFEGDIGEVLEQSAVVRFAEVLVQRLDQHLAGVDPVFHVPEVFDGGV